MQFSSLQIMEQDGGWKSVRKSVDKSLLKNIIRHTDAHNKIQEQNEMWKQWELKKLSRERDQSYKHDRHERGYMRSDIELSAAKKESQKWNRLLLEYEETQKDRWGHSGYKEMYPDEFGQENDCEIEIEDNATKKVKKTKEKSKQSRTIRSYSSKSDDESKPTSMNSKTRDNRKRDRKMEESKDRKTKHRQSKKSRRNRSDSDDSDVEIGHKETKTKSNNDFKLRTQEKTRRMKLGKQSKNERSNRKEKSQSKYIDFELSADDGKRKARPGSDFNNHREDRRSSYDIDDSVERNARKRNTIDVSTKSTRAVESDSSKKKKKH